MSRHKRNPGAGNATGASENDRAAKLIDPEVKRIHTDKQLIDRFGKRHSLAVLDNWSPAAIRALGIRRAEG